MNSIATQIENQLLFLISKDQFADALALANEWYEVLDSDDEVQLFYAPLISLL